MEDIACAKGSAGYQIQLSGSKHAFKPHLIALFAGIFLLGLGMGVIMCYALSAVGCETIPRVIMSGPGGVLIAPKVGKVGK
jgi:hypothetical protein